MQRSHDKSWIPYLGLLCLGVVVYYGIELRWLLRDFISGDTSVLIQWLEHLQQTGLQNALVNSVTNYTPVFTYLMAGVNTLLPGIENHYLIKLITNFGDLLTTLASYHLLRSAKCSPSKAVAGAAAIFVLPTVILNSNSFTQIESLVAAPLIIGISFLLRNRRSLAMLCIGAAFSIKFQSVFLFPALVILLVSQGQKLRSLCLVPFVYLLTILPTYFAGRDMSDLLLIYKGQTGQYRYLTYNAANVYHWLPNNYSVFMPLGVLFTLGVLFLVMVRKPQNLSSPENQLLFIATSLVFITFFLPKLHERYAYFSDVFTVLTAFAIPHLWPAAVLMVGASFCSYLPFLYLGGQIDKFFPFFALLAFGALVLLYQELERRQVIDLGKILSPVTEFLKAVHQLVWSDRTRLAAMLAYGIILIGLTQWHWLKLHEIYGYEKHEVLRYTVLTPIGGFLFVYVWSVINATLDRIVPMPADPRYWILDLPSWGVFVLFLGGHVVLDQPMKGGPVMLVMFASFFVVRILGNPRYNLQIAKRLIDLSRTYV